MSEKTVDAIMTKTDAILFETDMGFTDIYCPGALTDGVLLSSCRRVSNCSCDCDRCHCLLDFR
jgi:hypothetical protein